MWIALALSFVIGFVIRGFVDDTPNEEIVRLRFRNAALVTRQAQARRVLQPLMKIGVAAGFAPKKWVQYALDWLNKEDS